MHFETYKFQIDCFLLMKLNEATLMRLFFLIKTESKPVTKDKKIKNFQPKSKIPIETKRSSQIKKINTKKMPITDV